MLHTLAIATEKEKQNDILTQVLDPLLGQFAVDMNLCFLAHWGFYPNSVAMNTIQRLNLP